MGSPSYSSMNSLGSVGDTDSSYRVNIRIMIAAVIVLFSVILFILSLHLYAKWFWKNSQFATRRRRLLQLQQIYEIQQQIQAAEEDFHHPAAANNHLFHNPTAAGLDKSAIDSLPVFIFNEGSSGDEEQGKKVSDCCCAVCLSEFQNGDRARTLPQCGHSFHTDCIDMWLHSHSTCPLCRRSLLLDETEESAPGWLKSHDDLLLLRCPPVLADLEELVIVTSASTRERDSGVASSSSSPSGSISGMEAPGQQFVQRQSGENAQETSQQGVIEREKSASAKSRWRNLRRMLGLRDSTDGSTPSLCSTTSTRSSVHHPGTGGETSVALVD